MNNKDIGSENDILAIKSVDQYRTVDELIKKSQPNSVYYTLLFISTFIITGGILLENASIVIGGMLVTPVLTPVLLIALGIATGELGSTKGAAILIAKSSGIVIFGGFILSIFFDTPDSIAVLEDTTRVAILYFLVALSAGAAGTFAWARKDVIDIMPGVAIAVSLVPPLALVGIGLGGLDTSIARLFFFVFLLNLFGILVGSLVVFSLLQFYKTRNVIEEKTAEVEAVKKQRSGEEIKEEAPPAEPPVVPPPPPASPIA